MDEETGRSAETNSTPRMAFQYDVATAWEAASFSGDALTRKIAAAP
jgi:hypothetical protein